MSDMIQGFERRISKISMIRLRYLVATKSTLDENYKMLGTQFPIHQLHVVVYGTDLLLLEDAVVKRKLLPEEVLTLAQKPMADMLANALTFMERNFAGEYLLSLCEYKSFVEDKEFLNFNLINDDGCSYHVVYSADKGSLQVTGNTEDGLSYNWSNK